MTMIIIQCCNYNNPSKLLPLCLLLFGILLIVQNILIYHHHTDFRLYGITDQQRATKTMSSFLSHGSSQQHHLRQKNSHRGQQLQQQQQQKDQLKTEQKHYDASIVIQLTGEMGNNLNKIAYGYGLQLLAERRYNITTNLVMRHQEEHPKWRLAVQNLQQCFPNLKEFDYSAGNTVEFREKQLQQTLYYNADIGVEVDNDADMNSAVGQYLLNIPNSNEVTTNVALEKFSKIVKKQQTILNKNIESEGFDPELVQLLKQQQQGDKSNPINTTIRLPFIYANHMVDDYMKDILFDEYHTFFNFDNEACCNILPDENEIVYHFRNFKTELKKATKELGFTELSPYQTATELFINATASSSNRLAITTRFDNDWTQEYVHEIQKYHPSLQIRVISDQSAVEDFCFLKSAKRELVGHDLSSFFQWAAYLGIGSNDDSNGNDDGDNNTKNNSIQKIRSYAMKKMKENTIGGKDDVTPQKNGNDQHGLVHDHDPKWKHPILRERFHYETYFY